MKIVSRLLIIILICSSTFAQTKVGTTAANFLTIPVGARASAMGGAFTAIANDASAAYWNPAGLSKLTNNELNISYSEWLVFTKHNWVSLGIKLDDDDGIALSFNQLDYGQEEITTPDQPSGTGEFWSAQDLAIGVSYARNLTDRFSVGATVKYISQKIYNESANAYALDIGVLFYTQLEGLRIGMNISNFGSEMSLSGKDLLQPVDIDPAHTGNNSNIASNLSTDSWPLPLVFSVGLAYDIINNSDFKYTVATDAVVPNNESTYLNVGGELTWANLISFRAGFNSLFKGSEHSLSDPLLGGYAAGFGIQHDFGNFFAKIDYAYANYGIFNSVSKFSLSIGM